jgi:hypothetical protein
VERRIADGSWERIKTFPATTTEFTDSQTGRGEVFYRVRALNDAGESAYSNIVLLK